MSAKSKFTSADVRAMVRDVRSSCMGKRVANIYDISDKMYVFKFTATGGERLFLVMESGVRFHMTKYARQHHNQPSPFSMKLRGLLGTKRLEQIQQLGFDRVVFMRFGSGDFTNYVMLELYAGGNIVVTDENFKVVALLRSHQFATDVSLQVGEIYPMAHVTNIADSVATADTLLQGPFANFASFQNWLKERINQEVAAAAEEEEAKEAGKGNKKKSKAPNLRQIMLSKSSGIGDLGSDVIEHVLIKADIGPNLKLNQALNIDIAKFQSMVTNLNSAKGLVDSLDSVVGEGFIVFKDFDGSKQYLEYTPFLLAQHQECSLLTFPTFSEAVDDYYYKLEDQKAQHAANAEAEAAKKKLQKVREDQDKLIQNLKRQQKIMELSAQIVQAQAESIDKATLVINSFLASGMSWDDIEDTVEIEQAQGNPIASLISRLEFEQNAIVVKFPNPMVAELVGEEDGDLVDDLSGFLEIQVDLSLTAHANAAKMFQNKKAASIKESKTIKHSVQVTRAMEEQTMKKLENIKLSTSIKAIRKVHWFEKFNWFITSEGFLVLSGKDAQQNDLLFRRYLREHDIYVHADVHGASSCIVRAKRHAPENLDNPNVSRSDQKFYVTPLAIQEAGAMAVCRSRAWTAKFTASAYWVKASQVSKSAPTGEYLTTGAFMIYGKKNYLPPMPLEMGFGIMFRLDDESVGRHLKDRKIRSYDFDDAITIDESLSRYDLSLPTNDEGVLITDETNADMDSSDSEDDKQEVADDVGIAEPDEMSSNVESENHLKCGEQDQDTDTDPQEDEETLEEESLQVNYPDELQDDEEEQGEEEEEQGMEIQLDLQDTKGREQKNSKKQLPHPQQKKGGGSKKSKGEVKELETQTAKSDSMSTTSKAGKKKPLNKKKARRYAEQDEEDRELAMMVLGHRSKVTGETLEERRVKEEKAKEVEDIKKKQAKAGINFIKGNWEKSLGLLANDVRIALLDLVDEGKLKSGDIEDSDLRTLSTFSVENGLNIVATFANDPKLSIVKNKSGLLAAIMRRIAREIENSKIVHATFVEQPKEVVVNVSDLPGLSIEEKKEVMAIQEEEGILEAEEGKQADETEKLTGLSLPEDGLLYAIPVCAPYISMQNFKYKVKLTPGPMKKGKAAKLAVEIFLKSADLKEKSLMKGFTDNELVSAMIGDVKVSTPGLQQHQKQKKTQRGQKK